MAQSGTITVRLDLDTKTRLEQLARATQRSKSFLAAEAIRDYVELNEWQIAETESAIREAERGEFASDAEVADVFRRRGAAADENIRR
jgi:RHH-type rel operon transcriptional repressor/antitoxin RelB